MAKCAAMTTFTARLVRTVAAALLSVGLIMPAAAPAQAAGDGTLRFGTVADLDSMNPWNTALSIGFEVFTLNYDLLVGFGQELEPVPGFAESWSREDEADGTFTWTFKIHEGMKWSDGEPATAEDARWTYQWALDGIAEQGYVGFGYIDPDLYNAGVTSVEAPDATTLVIHNTDASDRILQMYIPILPKHIWQDQTLASNDTFANDPPVVGSGPYQAVEWQTGQFVRFERNPNYWGKQGAADQIVFQFYKSADTMVQALKSGELDYAIGLNADQFDELKSEPNIAVVNGVTNGWTMLNLNSYDQDIPGGGASTKALRDPKFRDALGYAIDKQALIDRVLGGYGDIGTTQVPPFQEKWHVEPDNPRTFDIELAKQKLTDAGYPLDASGQRLDKEGKPISLRLYMPTDSPNYPKMAEFIAGWFELVGIKVSTSIYDEATLLELELPPTEEAPDRTADWDMIIWSWTGYADPNPLLQIFTTSLIGSTNDSLYSNPEYDRLYDEQAVAATDEERHELMAQMQNLFYDEAPYHVLAYDDTLVAHRTDTFGGWTNQPANGYPLFGYGSFGYPLLTEPVAAAPSPSAAESAAPGASATPGASAAPGDSSNTGSDTTPILLLVAAAGVLVGGLLVVRGRRRAEREDD
jgi:peptide/nickel transport system substrate-binding protein